MPARKTTLLLLTACIILLGTSGGVSMVENNGLKTPSVNAYWLGPEIIITSENKAYEPAVAYNWKQGEYLVVWDWPDGIYGQRVNTSGELVGPIQFPISTGNKSRIEPAVEYDPNNNRYLVVWAHEISGNNTNYDLSGRFIPWQGASPDYKEFKISALPSHQNKPKLAYHTANEEFLVIWWDWILSDQQIFGVRLKASDGTTIGNAKQLFTGAKFHWSADVAFNSKSGEYLVAWDKLKNALDVYGIRLNGDNLSPFPQGEFVIAGWPQKEVITAVAACRHDNQYLVLWGSEVTSSNIDIFGRIIHGDGTVSTTVHKLQGTSRSEYNPDVACNTSGKYFLAVWQKEYTSTFTSRGIWGSLVSPEGGSSIRPCPECGTEPYTTSAADPAFEINAPSNANPDLTNPAVAGGDDQYLVVWESARQDGYNSIHARVVYFFKEPPGKIYVYKHTQPRYTGGSFNVELTGGPPSDFIIRNFYLKDDDVPFNSGPIKAGDYSLIEVLYDKWDFVSAACDDGSQISAIGLDPAEVVKCTFVNKYPVKYDYLPLILKKK